MQVTQPSNYYSLLVQVRKKVKNQFCSLRRVLRFLLGQESILGFSIKHI